MFSMAGRSPRPCQCPLPQRGDARVKRKVCMLHDPSHYEPPRPCEEIRLDVRDRDILRGLASEIAEIAALPVHRERASLWTRLNDLESVRPMVWINEIPWHEMNVDGELDLRCRHPWARDQERDLRRTIYQWNHLPGDMVVSDFLTCPLALHSTDFGIIEEVDVVRTDAESDIVSRHFHKQIGCRDDLEKIRMPVVTHDERATSYWWAAMNAVYADVIPIRKMGQTHIWFTPWDYLIRWYGIEEAMIDMVDMPELIHAAVERLVDAWMVELDQFMALDALSLDCNNTRIGSGGYGYTKELPGRDFDADHVRPINMWGCSNAQIFSEVSPDFQWAFAIRHELRWMERWGLNYYGCCEPLDLKMDLMRRIPRLRKVSMNFRIKMERAAAAVGRDFVFSYKPNPAVFAGDVWRPALAREEIRHCLEVTRGMHVELIMKDISTVRHEPQRLWEWARIAVEEAERIA